MFQCQTYLLESALSSSTTSNSLPPLLETNPTTTLVECQSQAAMQLQLQAFQNPFQIRQPPENDLKRFMSSVMSQSNLLSSSEQLHKSSISINPIITNAANNNNNMLYAPSPSILFKSLLSHQDSTVLLKQQQQQHQQQQFNKAADSSSFTTHNFDPAEAEANSNLMDIKKMMVPNASPCSYHQHPLFFETECNSPPPLPAHVSLHDTSTSISFNRPAYQTLLDPHINILHAHGDSWPLDA